jgi:hypothetical protein
VTSLRPTPHAYTEYAAALEPADKFIQTGTLRVFDSRGRLHSFGDKQPGPTVTLRLGRQNEGLVAKRRSWLSL